MRVLLAVCGLLLSLGQASSGEYRVEYVDANFCQDLLTLEALDQYVFIKWSSPEVYQMEFSRRE